MQDALSAELYTRLPLKARAVDLAWVVPLGQQRRFLPDGVDHTLADLSANGCYRKRRLSLNNS